MPPPSLPPVVTRMHPRYIEWLPVWRELGYLYEGDGPYITGDALIPHVRELLYKQLSDESYDFNNPVGYKVKYRHRQELARYENFASVIIDTLADHQYLKEVHRSVQSPSKTVENHPLMDWWDDVDGFGQSMDDWLRHYQPLANVYGHIFVVMDRMIEGNPTVTSVTGNALRSTMTRPPRSLANQGRPVLRAYVPPDVPDWLTTNIHQLTTIKVIEPVDRTSLTEAVQPAQLNYLIVDKKNITRFDNYGKQTETHPHGFGMLPVIIFYGRRRARIPILGRSLLRDPKVFKDHYNLVSELREILRSQTFSMLNIQLGDKETVTEARNRLGDHAGTDALVFTKGPATFIAPPDGPVTAYAQHLEALEKNIYRIAGIPWSSDKRQAEAVGSMQMKAQDLNRTLAKNANEAERFEYQAAKLWFAFTNGAAKADQALKDAELIIRHPTEFNTEDLMTALTEALTALSVGLGPTATTLIKGNLVPLLLKNIPNDETDQIEKEIDERTQADEVQRLGMNELALNPPAPVVGARSGLSKGAGTPLKKAPSSTRLGAPKVAAK